MSETKVQAKFESVVELIRQNLVDDEVAFGPGELHPEQPQFEQPFRYPLTDSEVREINDAIDTACKDLSEADAVMLRCELQHFFSAIESGEHKFNGLLGNQDQPVEEALEPIKAHVGVCLRSGTPRR